MGEVLSSVITVNAPDDVDDGIADETHTSLREAIHAANNHMGPDLIQFDLPAGLHVLQLAHDLPALLDDGTTIDGTTQPGYAGTPVLELRGTLASVDESVVMAPPRPG